MVAIVVSDHRHNDRHFDDPLPYGAVVELNGHAVGRIERAFVPCFCPDVTRIVDPATRWHACFVHQVQLPVGLRQISKRPRAGKAQPYALEFTCEIQDLAVRLAVSTVAAPTSVIKLALIVRLLEDSNT